MEIAWRLHGRLWKVRGPAAWLLIVLIETPSSPVSGGGGDGPREGTPLGGSLVQALPSGHVIWRAWWSTCPPGRLVRPSA